MQDTDPSAAGWRAAVGRVVADEAELASTVARDLDEPVEQVRATVALWLLLHGVAATAEDLDDVVASLRRRARDASRGAVTVPADRAIPAESLDALLAWTRRATTDHRPDARLVIDVQRAAGAIAARSGLRLVLFLGRLTIGRRLVWERCLDEVAAGRLDRGVLPDLGRWLLLWSELTSLAVTEGYRAAEREILARDADARRAALDELLGVTAADPAAIARARRVAARFGLDPDWAFRLVAVAPPAEADPTPETPGLDQGDLEVLASRIGHLVGASGAGAEGAGAGIRLPVVLAMRGRIVILARADWVALGRLPEVLDRVLGGAGGGPHARGGWVAVGSAPLDGVVPLAGALADLLDAVRTAGAIGRRGWVPDPGGLAVERLLLASPELAEAAVLRELGPLLADERMGEELVETLQVYFDSGENMRETARRLHLANRTVAYRIERIEAMLGGPLEGELRRRLSVALLVRRLRAWG